MKAVSPPRNPATIPARFAKSVLLLAAVVVMSRELGAPIQGNFYFRQAHVIANIEHFVENGVSLVPATYNLDVPYRIFDFPVYQFLVAAICRTLGSEPLLTARITNVVVFVLSFLLVDRLLLAAGLSRMHRLGCGFLFCWAPMNLFYYQSPLVDPLAIALSLLSLYAFLRLEETRGARRTLLFGLVLLSGVLSTLFKNPSTCRSSSPSYFRPSPNASNGCAARSFSSMSPRWRARSSSSRAGRIESTE